MPGDDKSYVSGSFSLTLDGIDCGMIQKFEGGNASADAVALPAAHDYLPKKNIGNVQYNDFAVRMAMPMAQPVQDWIVASLSMNYQRKSGELKAADVQGKAPQVHAFSEAVLTEIGFPACDGGAKDPAVISLRFSPEVVRNKPGDDRAGSALANTKQKMLRASNFSLTIDGIAAAAKVTQIDAFTVTLEPGKIDMPNLSLTLAEADAADFMAWHEDFVINGNNDESKHKTGALTYRDQTLQKELITISFAGLGISTITPVPRAAPDDAIAKVRVELQVERMKVSFP